MYILQDTEEKCEQTAIIQRKLKNALVGSEMCAKHLFKVKKLQSIMLTL